MCTLLTIVQVLSITCNNTSANDTMIDKLSKLLKEFPGSANHTRCFNHILNLIAKSIMRQFDLPKAKVGEALEATAEALVWVLVVILRVKKCP